MIIKDPQKFQKVAFGFLIFIGIFSIFFGIGLILNNLSSPFSSNSNKLATPEGEKSVLLEDLKTKDTDQDGFSDYDELYFYNTSPYLEDSDSDGQTDKTEIEAKTDPNCPEGVDCRGFSTNTNENVNANTNVSAGSMSAEELRAALKAAGASETVLNQVDDEALMQLYQEIIAESPELLPQSNQNVSNLNTNAGTSDFSLENLQNLTPAEIREFLILGGADENVLNQVDDATLQEIFSEALKEQGGT